MDDDKACDPVEYWLVMCDGEAMNHLRLGCLFDEKRAAITALEGWRHQCPNSCFYVVGVKEFARHA